jgi:hypothetical protein
MHHGVIEHPIIPRPPRFHPQGERSRVPVPKSQPRFGAMVAYLVPIDAGYNPPFLWVSARTST